MASKKAKTKDKNSSKSPVSSKYTIKSESLGSSLKTGLDPKLHRIVLNEASRPADEDVVRRGAGEETVDVIAILRNPNQQVDGLQVVRTIGNVVTGTVDCDRIEEVRGHRNVKSLKMARKVQKTLDFSLPEIRGTQTQIRSVTGGGNKSIDGSGVIVGIVDYGCDFAHPNFRKDGCGTRILYLWDQSEKRSNQPPPQSYGYGREFDSAAINNALGFSNPYAALYYKPEDAAHGTHVMDIAAGNGRSTGSPGVAPNSDIIFVDLSSGKVGEEESLGNSRRLLEAVDYIFDKADKLGKPAVVNISLGTQGGPHDGSTPIEEGFDTLLQTPGRAIVISAGNFFGLRGHANNTIQPRGRIELEWVINRADRTDNEMEIWYEGGQELSLSLEDPDGVRVGPFPLGTAQSVVSDNRDVALVFHRKDDPNNRDNQIDILLRKTAASGSSGGDQTLTWKVVLENVSQSPAEFHAWIERDDPGQSMFKKEISVDEFTIGSISCGQNTIVVGAYDPRSSIKRPFSNSSAGPTRDGKNKPEVSAPGDNIRAARSLSPGAIRMSGTSMSAPHVTGLIALLMQASGRPLSIREIREAITYTNPAGAAAWDKRMGLRRIDVQSALSRVLNTIGSTPGSTSPITTASVSGLPNANGRNSISLNNLFAELAGEANNLNVQVSFEMKVEPKPR